jgi:hypothetical protein
MRPLAARPELGFDIAPFTVLVDPLRHIQPEQGAADYVYRKQLEEGELLGLTKLDAVDPQLGQAVLHRLRQRFGPDRVLPLAAASGAGVGVWLDAALARTSTLAQRVEIDYATYAAAEAALGWLNARGSVASDVAFSAQNWLAYLLKMLDAGLRAAGGDIAHVKAQVRAGGVTYKASITQSGGPLSWDLRGTDGRDGETRNEGDGGVQRLEFILNARVETSPAVLAEIVRATMAELNPEPHFTYTFTSFTCISPAAPQPTERIAA